MRNETVLYDETNKQIIDNRNHIYLSAPYDDTQDILNVFDDLLKFIGFELLIANEDSSDITMSIGVKKE